jgi:hypothetical protein
MIGDVIFVRTSSPMSWIIRKISDSEYSHVCISVSNDNDYVIEADVFQRIKVIRNRYRETKTVQISMSEEERIRLLLFLLTYAEKPYDYKQIFGFLFRLLGLSRQENLWNSRNRIICSELIDLGYLSIGIDLVPNRVDGDITPQDLAANLKG